MQIKIDAYFELCEPKLLKIDGQVMLDRNNNPVYEINPPTVTGMALYLGFCNRASMYDYLEKEEFTHTIKKAVAGIEAYAERAILTGAKPVGAIFWLKNHGWNAEENKKVEVTAPVIVDDVPEELTAADEDEPDEEATRSED